MPRDERMRHISDEELYRRLGDAFLDICFSETEGGVAKAHMRFSRLALEQQRRLSADRRAIQRRSKASGYGDSGQVQS